MPITFVEREVGDSKMSRDIMTESLRRITAWGVRHRAAPGARAGRRHARAEVAHAVSRPGATPYAAAGRRRRPRVLRWVFLALLIVPVLEIAAIIAVGRVIGGWQTLLLLVLESLLGAWIVKREGSRTWTALQDALRSGRMPSRQLSDAALVLIGGTLLLTPGFVTDIVGLLLHPAADPPDHPGLARDRRRPPAARPDGGVAGVRAGTGARRADRGSPASGPAGRGRPDVVPGEVVEGTVVDPDRP